MERKVISIQALNFYYVFSRNMLNTDISPLEVRSETVKLKKKPSDLLDDIRVSFQSKNVTIVCRDSDSKLQTSSILLSMASGFLKSLVTERYGFTRKIRNYLNNPLLG